ncbi:MAG: hybrid sensor histidine kinase/response regulator [Pseudomonadota bacterium]
MAAAAEFCLASRTPSMLFAGRPLVPVAASRTYDDLDVGQLRRREEWPRLAAVIRGVMDSGIPAEMEIGGQADAARTIRVHCAPVVGCDAVLVWLNGPRLADIEVRRAAERTIAAKSRFLAAASHDLRQPFQAMRLFHSILADQPLGAEGRRAVTMLGQAMESGEQLLDALLDISTLEAGTVQPKPAEFDLAHMVARVADEFRGQAEAKGLCLRTRTPSAKVCTDPILVERIVRNLLANAISFTRKGGVLIAVRPSRTAARVEVWDTGFGIPEHQLATVFEEFHQLENPERDKSRGLGLGLAIVKRLAGLLDLPVDVRSQPGRGTVFTVGVPLLGGDAGAGEEAEAEAPMDATDRTILVVEDDGMVLMGLTMILETWGMKVLAAEDMAQVIEKLDQGRPQVILSDLRLRAGLSGFDVVDRVRAMLGDPVPAVILTGETGKQELEEGRRRQLTFLHKPIQPDMLREAIGSALPRM